MSKPVKVYVFVTLFLIVVIAYISTVYILDKQYPIRNYGHGELVITIQRVLGKNIQVVEINTEGSKAVKVRYEIINPSDENNFGTALFKRGFNTQFRLESNSVSTEPVLR